MMTYAIRLSVLVALAALAGCGHSTSEKACTAMGCSDGYQIDFRPASWPAGAYRLEIQADGKAIACASTLPFPSTEPKGGCDASEVTLGLSGTALPADQHTLWGLMFTSKPKSVTVRALRDATKVAEQTFAPTYQTLQPNGPSCEPTCVYAHNEMSW